MTTRDHRHAATVVDQPTAWLALIAIAAVAPVTSSLLPAIVAALVDEQQFAAESAGYVSALYSAAGMVAGLLGLLWMKYVDRRRMLTLAILLGLVADLCAVWAVGYPAIAVGRFVTGFAASTALIVVNTTIALSRRPQCLFGIVVTAQSLLAALVFFAWPRLSWGGTELFLALAVCWALVLPITYWVPAIPRAEASESHSRGRSTGRGLRRSSSVLLALAFLSFCIGTGALWTFLYLIGLWHDIAPKDVGSAISLGMLCAVAGSLSATLLGARHDHVPPLILALVANVGFTAILLLPVGLGAFMAVSCAVNYLFAFALPLFLTQLGLEDPQGRLLSLGNTIICGGLALGPSLLGPSTAGGSYELLICVTVAFFALSPGLLYARRLLASRVGTERRGEALADTP